MAHLNRHSRFDMTDSGGIQEEAPSLGRHVLVMRRVSERPEGVEAGVATLVGTDEARIVAEGARLLEQHSADAMGGKSPYGDGHAAERIIAAITPAAHVTADPLTPAPGGSPPTG
jgi:UDP-N-acetylglucosamine 2-epimerase